jgi:hypothetical protein
MNLMTHATQIRHNVSDLVFLLVVGAGVGGSLAFHAQTPVALVTHESGWGFTSLADALHHLQTDLSNQSTIWAKPGVQRRRSCDRGTWASLTILRAMSKLRETVTFVSALLAEMQAAFPACQLGECLVTYIALCTIIQRVVE